MIDFGPTTHRTIAVLNRKVEVGRLMNALGHMTAGLISLYSDLSDMRFQTYIDKDNGEHKNISDNPFIILKSDNSNQIRSLRNELQNRGIKFTDFTNTMIVGTYIDQHKRTSEIPEIDLEYWGICFFADNETAKELTRKFSLFN